MNEQITIFFKTKDLKNTYLNKEIKMNKTDKISYILNYYLKLLNQEKNFIYFTFYYNEFNLKDSKYINLKFENIISDENNIIIYVDIKNTSNKKITNKEFEDSKEQLENESEFEKLFSKIFCNNCFFKKCSSIIISDLSNDEKDKANKNSNSNINNDIENKKILINCGQIFSSIIEYRQNQARFSKKKLNEINNDNEIENENFLKIEINIKFIKINESKQNEKCIINLPSILKLCLLKEISLKIKIKKLIN